MCVRFPIAEADFGNSDDEFTGKVGDWIVGLY